MLKYWACLLVVLLEPGFPWLKASDLLQRGELKMSSSWYTPSTHSCRRSRPRRKAGASSVCFPLREVVTSPSGRTVLRCSTACAMHGLPWPWNTKLRSTLVEVRATWIWMRFL